MINHITCHILDEEFDDVRELMTELGFHEIPADDPFEHGYNVRWYSDGLGSPNVHFVADGGSGDWLQLGHFCVVLGSQAHFERLKRSRFLVRDSGSGRIWLQVADNVRVEVRP